MVLIITLYQMVLYFNMCFQNKMFAYGFLSDYFSVRANYFQPKGNFENPRHDFGSQCLHNNMQLPIVS